MRAAALVFLIGVAACALLPPDEGMHNPTAILDAYLIAHGMAQSYGDEPNADPAVTQELARLDQRAAAAIQELARSRTSDTDETARAVAELSDYAAAQTDMPR